ncbi:MAG: hypothetical protein ISR50_01145 [Alphaproteobacteria bacterium]|nr:hypothetical protein [Alphaproteobacteria bacterium]
MAKFLFDNHFDVDGSGKLKPDEKPEALYTEENLAAARGEAQQIGFAAGKEEAMGEIENLAANTLQNIAAAIGNIGAQHEQAVLALKQEAAQMAMVIAGKLAPALLQKEPLYEIRSLIKECLELVPDEPRIVVRVDESLVDFLAEDIDQLAIRGGFQGSVVLLGEANITGADCRVEWADGGAERNVDALFQKIETAVSRYCANIADQVEQIEQAIQKDKSQAGDHDADQDMTAQSQSGEDLLIAASSIDDDPFPLPPGAENVGVVENPLPRLSRAAGYVPSPHDDAKDELAPTATIEP